MNKTDFVDLEALSLSKPFLMDASGNCPVGSYRNRLFQGKFENQKVVESISGSTVL